MRHKLPSCRVALLGLCLNIAPLLLACTSLRSPQYPASVDWPAPVLPPLQQPSTSPVESAPFDDLLSLLPGEARHFDVVADGVPAAEVFSQLAGHAGLALAIHLPLERKIWLRLEQRPLHELLDGIAAQCACRYQLAAGKLDVYADEPYLQSYPVDYLNLRRQMSSALSVDTQVGNLAATDSSVAIDASRSSLRADGVNDPMQSLLSGLHLVLGGDQQIDVHREAGLVMVRGTWRQHRAVASYIARVVARLQRQVLIEASVIEVALDEHHAAGVDWQQLSSGDGVSWVQQLGGGVIGVEEAGAVLRFDRSSGQTSTAVAVQLLQRYGDVRVVSSPRIVALNNQPSLLKVVDNLVYFSLDASRERDTELAVDRLSVDTAIHTVPVGLVMQVTPQISASGEVLMSIRPTVSRVINYAVDPSPELADAGLQNLIPEIQVRELEATLRIQSGRTVALGGLRQLHDGSRRNQVPGVSRLPLLGSLFQSRGVERRQVELLILLTPRVLPAEGSV